MRLVVQGLSIQSSHLDYLSGLCGDFRQQPGFIQTSAQAYYLPFKTDERIDDHTRNEIEIYCISHFIDWALVPDAHTLQNFGLLVMDMDSTLINIECIDEIADMHGLKPEVARITESAMRGEIEFAQSLKLRVALLEGLDESALLRVYDERLRLNPGAEALVAACKTHHIRTMLVSGGFDFFADRAKTMAGLDYAHANRLEIVNGKLTGRLLGDVLDGQAKANWLVEVRDSLGLKPHQTIALGDGANDLKMMGVAGISIAYHAKPVVQSQATYALNHVGLDGVAGLLTVNG
ncbi:MAG TPA: phosphoserine phosphatase SerB [Methylophilaceae bacterium]|nr:phosphoserine phosphatase SerB [Methylophilaceae bacterium]